jgi:CheY-like chemotaxis protein
MKNRLFNILVADDDPAIRTCVSAILHRRGHTVDVVDNGNEAMNLFTLKPDYYDILITDHNMPMVSGLELVHYLRKSNVNTKIIVMSGSLTVELMNAYQNKRVDKILQKPFMLENLSSALNGILEQWNGLARA